ncbi:DUF4190 domain-containing protein [Streptomyces sp. HNM0574]|uniref:DUF4190 domain-containing protein n=1 Tax=Streptomyces sp. HNM0574 TaxID=2714954 RepID=UPI00146C8301|nr:DUF4190 domain-containing protein [Streptomyces sp. HNM0574]NLU70606.1 DUF4190 domain-containing protein [Streptomyces sp. HNM0574]
MSATHTLDAHHRPAATAPDRNPATTPAAPPKPAAATAAGRVRDRDADGMAVASFVLGLTGLLVFNLILGPCALVLGGLALLRGTSRRGRAVFGMTLGAADLVVLALAVGSGQAMTWTLAG